MNELLPSVEIGLKIRTLRGEIPREKMARDLDISLRALIAYELGERVPRDEVKVSIANYLGVTVQEIFFIKE